MNEAVDSGLSPENIPLHGQNRIFQLKNRISKSDRLLGRALESLGDRSTWSEVRAFWQSAEQAYLEALKMRTIEETPYNHNATKANLERVQFKLNL